MYLAAKRVDEMEKNVKISMKSCLTFEANKYFKYLKQGDVLMRLGDDESRTEFGRTLKHLESTIDSNNCVTCKTEWPSQLDLCTGVASNGQIGNVPWGVGYQNRTEQPIS